MNAVRIRTRVESETLHLPELRAVIGKQVEIIVVEKPADPAPPTGLAMLHELAGRIDLDFEAIEKLREISKI